MIAVIALGWFVIIQTKNAKPREIQKHLELAQKKEEQQIYVDALAEYKAALELDPERIDVYQKVVLLDYKMGQFSEFETQANALLTKTPNSYEVLNTLLSYYNDSAQKTPAVRKNVRGMNAPITNNATIIPTGFSSGIVGFSWPDVLQNAVIRCIALLFQEKHFR